MKGGLGLINSYRDKIHEPLQKRRAEGQVALAKGKGVSHTGVVISFKDFCKENKLTNADGDTLDLPDLWHEFGLNPMTASWSDVMTTPDSIDVRYFIAEVVRDFILYGMTVAPWYQRLCMDSIPAKAMHVITPWIEFDESEMEAVGEGETAPETDYAWGTKGKDLSKYMEKISVADELLYQVTFPILSKWLMRVGVKLQAKLNRACIRTLYYGDKADGSDAVRKIGIAAPGANGAPTIGLVFDDLVTPWVRGKMINFLWHSVACSELDSRHILGLREFKWREFDARWGAEMVKLSDKDQIIPSEVGHFPNITMPQGQIMLVDPAWAMLFLTFMGLRVEVDRIVDRQLNGTVASIISDFTTVDPRARICLDTTTTFTDFPALYQPLA